MDLFYSNYTNESGTTGRSSEYPVAKHDSEPIPSKDSTTRVPRDVVRRDGRRVISIDGPVTNCWIRSRSRSPSRTTPSHRVVLEGDDGRLEEGAYRVESLRRSRSRLVGEGIRSGRSWRTWLRDRSRAQPSLESAARRRVRRGRDRAVGGVFGRRRAPTTARAGTRERPVRTAIRRDPRAPRRKRFRPS